MHTDNTFCTRICMLEDQGYYNPTANATGAPLNSNRSQDDTGIGSISDVTDSSDINSLLASAFNIMGGHQEEKDAIASSMMELNQDWRLYHWLILVLISILYLWFFILTPLLYLLHNHIHYPSLLLRLIIPNHQPREPHISPRNQGSVLHHILHRTINHHYFMST